MDAEMNLSELEQTLKTHIDRFDRWQQYQIWLIFERIYREQLWRKQKYHNFSNYCLDMWGYEKSHAYRLVAAGEVIISLTEDNLMSDLDLPFPDTLSVAMKLYKHPSAKRLPIWKAHLDGVPIPAARSTLFPKLSNTTRSILTPQD
jgi:hypothetical protein